mmetsp:Transcript_38368/g.104453  ORF Transcript_38368/g.104453 Transcript_38368/m.104453 type:complete len:87 (+) Transcript_38368:579-839(+)
MWSKIWFNSLGISASAKKTKSKNFEKAMNFMSGFAAVVLTGSLVAGFQDLMTYACIVITIAIAIAYAYGSSKLAQMLDRRGGARRR